MAITITLASYITHLYLITTTILRGPPYVTGLYYNYFNEIGIEFVLFVVSIPLVFYYIRDIINEMLKIKVKVS